MRKNGYIFIVLLMSAIFMGCANITAPTGGKKDTIPPKLTAIEPRDSSRTSRIKRIDLDFDENITVNDVFKEVQTSPILSIAPTVTGKNKRVTVKIIDSLLEDSTTYRISFGSSIRDLHEGNAFPKYTYTFSTCSYFDSLELKGRAINAGTGLPDTAGITVILYPADAKDSAIVKQKPKYMASADAKGNFTFKGLPKKKFRIYAIKDANSNLLYDGAEEMIAFNENLVLPGEVSDKPLLLRLFSEKTDTAKPAEKETKVRTEGKPSKKDASISYTTNIDTIEASKRTFDITKPLSLTFSKSAKLNKDKVNLFLEKEGVATKVPYTITSDTAHPGQFKFEVAWEENTKYTFKLAKGFAVDTGGVEAQPSKYTFTTKEDDDYGKFRINIPSKYYGKGFLLQVNTEKDTIYTKPITDTVVYLTRLQPVKYFFRIIVDKNGNGQWDTGRLFDKVQPEEVFPYPEPVKSRAGWENTIDFEPNKSNR